MTQYDVRYGYTRELGKVPFDAAIQRVTEALKGEGFGVLTRIDVHDIFKAKLGKDFRKYAILGACNPRYASEALGAELGVGLVLPCNVTVFEGDDGQAVVQIAKPAAMFEVIHNPALESLVSQVDQHLKRALEKV